MGSIHKIFDENLGMVILGDNAAGSGIAEGLLRLRSATLLWLCLCRFGASTIDILLFSKTWGLITREPGRESGSIVINSLEWGFQN